MIRNERQRNDYWQGWHKRQRSDGWQGWHKRQRMTHGEGALSHGMMGGNTMISVKTKRCSRCHKVLPLEEFTGRWRGERAWCQACRERRREWILRRKRGDEVWDWLVEEAQRVRWSVVEPHALNVRLGRRRLEDRDDEIVWEVI